MVKVVELDITNDVPKEIVGEGSKRKSMEPASEEGEGGKKIKLSSLEAEAEAEVHGEQEEEEAVVGE